MRKSIVLLLPCLQLTRQLVYSLPFLPNNRSPVTLSFNYPVYKQLVNLSSRYLVYQIIVLLLLCLSITLSTSNSLTRLLVNLSTKQNLTLSFVLLITHYRPSSHKETYSREGKQLMRYTTDVSTADKYCTHRLNEVAHRVDISGKISKRWHRTCWSE